MTTGNEYLKIIFKKMKERNGFRKVTNQRKQKEKNDQEVSDDEEDKEAEKRECHWNLDSVWFIESFYHS